MWTKESVCRLPSTVLEICPCFFKSVFVVLIFFEHSLALNVAPLFLSFQRALICYQSKQTNKQTTKSAIKVFLVMITRVWICPFVLFVPLNLCNLCKPTISQKVLDFCHNGSSSLKLYSTWTIASVSKVSIVANAFKRSSGVCTSSIHVTIMAVIFAFISICIGSERESDKLSKGRVCL